MNIEKNIAVSSERKPQTALRAWARTEAGFVGLVIAFVLVITSIPYLFAYLSTPPGKTYMGIMLDVPDHAQYFSWMRELTHANLAANKMTPEANRPLFFNLLWWGMGRLGRLFGLGFAEMFQVLRVVSTVVFLILAYRLCRLFLKEEFHRRTAFLLITFTSGLGWAWVVVKYLNGGDLLYPLDVYVAESNTFLGMLGYPHFIAALWYIFVFELVLRGQGSGQLRYAVGAGLFAQFLGWQHAYDLVSIYGVLFAYAVLLTLRDRRLPRYLIISGLIIGSLSVWPAVYSVVLTSFDPIWKEVLRQFANAGVYTPNLLHLPILLGAGFLLALYTVLRENPFRLKGLSDGELFLRGWFWVSFLLVYLPVDYQIHLLNGWQVPFSILATIGLFRYVVPWLERQLAKRPRGFSLSAEGVRRLSAAGLIVLVLPTNLYLWTWRFIDLNRHTYPYYLYNEELAALQWLEQNVRPADVVFSSLTIGQYVPALTGAHAFLAHWAQTVNFYTRSQQVERFFRGELSPEEQKGVFESASVDYVFWGPAEREVGQAPPGGEGVSPVYENPLVTIFKVRP